MLDIKDIMLDGFKSNRVVTMPYAEKLIAELKSQNKKIGLCHGGFDLLHPGHIKHLESSKALCDVLFVSVTSDRYVASRKGRGRPIYNDKLRAYMVANVKFVDYAVVSDYETAVEVIKILKPDYYIKGPDYEDTSTQGITIEKNAILSVGGEIRYTSEPKLSTTDIIKHIKT